ncbi:MAG: YabP/YqfC family sporulation protein [Firmicutes bacterium]|nr:YabP/YqfC family sporulation protein [Bacillota bacterium]
MSFFSEIAKNIGLNELSLSGGYSVINYNGEAVYLEGVIRLLSIEDDTIALQLRGANVIVAGMGLRISELSGGCIIKGDIQNLSFEKRRKKHGK